MKENEIYAIIFTDGGLKEKGEIVEVIDFDGNSFHCKRSNGTRCYPEPDQVQLLIKLDCETLKKMGFHRRNSGDSGSFQAYMEEPLYKEIRFADLVKRGLGKQIG